MERKNNEQGSREEKKGETLAYSARICNKAMWAIGYMFISVECEYMY